MVRHFGEYDTICWPNGTDGGETGAWIPASMAEGEALTGAGQTEGGQRDIDGDGVPDACQVLQIVDAYDLADLVPPETIARLQDQCAN